MKILNRHADGTPRTVELTWSEDRCADAYERYLDRGLGIREAARIALKNAPPDSLTQDFVSWLSDRTLTVVEGKVAIQPERATLVVTVPDDAHGPVICDDDIQPTG